MAYQDSSNGALAPVKERLSSRKSLSPNVSPRHSRRATPQTSPDRVSMQYVINQNSGQAPKQPVRYMRSTEGSHHSRHHSRHGSTRGSQEMLEQQPMLKNKNDFNQVVGLMDKNLEALMVRDHTIHAASRRGSAIEDNTGWQQRGPKPSRSSCTCPNYKFWLCLFATIFLLSCIGVASFIIYYFLQSSENPTTKIADGRYVETHHDWSVHDSWDSSNDPGANGEVAWRKSGGIWSKSKPPGGREVVVKIKGQFIPGEQEVPEGELSEGHSPM